MGRKWENPHPYQGESFLDFRAWFSRLMRQLAEFFKFVVTTEEGGDVHLAGNLVMEDGATVDGVDLSEIDWENLSEIDWENLGGGEVGEHDHDPTEYFQERPSVRISTGLNQVGSYYSVESAASGLGLLRGVINSSVPAGNHTAVVIIEFPKAKDGTYFGTGVISSFTSPIIPLIVVWRRSKIASLTEVSFIRADREGYLTANELNSLLSGNSLQFSIPFHFDTDLFGPAGS